MAWARGIIGRMQRCAAVQKGVVEPDPRLVMAALALGVIAGALLW